MVDSVKKYLRVLFNIAIPLAAVYVVCYWGPRLLKFFMPFVIGWLIAMIANPLVRFLERRLKILRKHGSMLIVVAVLGLIIGLFYLLVTKLVIEMSYFVQALPDLYETISLEISKAMSNFEHLFLRLPEHVQDSVNEFSENLGSYVSMAVQKIASPTVTAAGNVAKSIPSILVNTIITILSSYFFIVERDRIMEFVRKHIPEEGKRYYQFLKDDLKHLIGGYFLAQFRIMFVVAAILVVGFLILQVRFALPLAILIAVLDFLPLFGTGTALFPWAAVKLFSGEYAFGVGLILLYVLTQVVRQIIQPKIVGDTMGLPPLLTLVFLYLGFKAHGISGMILAVPIGLFAMNLYEFGAFDSLIENIKILVRDINRFRRGK